MTSMEKEGLRVEVERSLARWGERAEGTFASGLVFRPGLPVEVRVTKRGIRYDIDDRGLAVSLAGRPPGWLRLAEHVVADEGLNVNRRGVVFVPAVEGRDIAGLAQRMAATSLALHERLLESRDEPG